MSKILTKELFHDEMVKAYSDFEEYDSEEGLSQVLPENYSDMNLYDRYKFWMSLSGTFSMPTMIKYYGTKMDPLVTSFLEEIIREQEAAVQVVCNRYS